MRFLLIPALVLAAAGPALAQSDFPDPPMPQMSGDQPGPRLAALASRGARDPEAWRAGLGASEVRWVPAEPPGPRGLGASLALDGGRGAVLDLAFG